MDSLTLAEATTDQIFQELRDRFPEGVLLVSLRSPREGQDFDPEFECRSWNTYACIGLARVSEQILVNKEAKDGVGEEIEEEDREEDA